MAGSNFVFRYHGVTGVESDAATSRDGAAVSVLPARVLADVNVQVVGQAAAFELDPALPTRDGDWSGLAGTVEVLSQQEHDEPELLIVRSGDSYRVVIPERSDDHGLRYQIPVSPGPSVDRGAFGGALRWLVQKVVMPSVGGVVTETGVRAIRRWEAAARPHAMRYYTPARYRSPRSEPVQPSDLRGGSTLLLLHGTNAQSHDANGLAGMEAGLIEHFNRAYDQVLAFDHPTLTATPDENVAALLEWFADSPAPIPQVDLLCHSRGGLVARALLGRSDLPFEVRTVVFVATPHRGTELADPQHLGGFVDRMLTLALVIPDNPVSLAIEGALTIAKEMATGLADRLEGVVCMKPGNDWLRNLPGPCREVSFRAIASDFEALPGSGAWHALRDRGVDLVFGGWPNDTIVPTLSALQLTEEPGSGFDEIVVFDDLDGINHSRYFASALVQPVLQTWLGRKPAMLAGAAAARVRTASDVRALASLGAEWSLSKSVADLACFAPEPVRPELSKKLESLGARVWGWLAGRDEKAPRSTVVLLPGVMGSELMDGDQRVWLSPWRLAQGGFQRLALGGPNEPEIVATEMLCFAYRRMLDHFRAKREVVEFAYDWRRSIDTAAASLVDVLRALVEDDDRPAGAPIHVVAHSMGGIVVRRARQLAAGSPSDPFESIEGRIVLLGTPNHGSFSAPLALLGRHPLVSNLSRLDARLSKRDWLDLIWTFPGVIELLPDPGGISEDGGPPVPLDWLYEVDRWPGRSDARAIAERLADAKRLRHELSSDQGEGLHVILGVGFDTPTAVRPIGADGFEVAMGKEGDGTVAVACGVLEKAAVHLAGGVNHADLVRDRKVLSAVDQLLDEGTTRLLRSRADRGGERASPGMRHWISPAAAELALDRRRTVSRDGAAPVLHRAWSRRDVTLAGFDAVAGLMPAPKADEPDLKVRVVHASLEHAAFPVLIGHGTGTPIAGAEARCDALLERQLSDLNVLGSYPNTRGSHLYVPRTKPSHRLHGCVVVALDSRAPLSSGELSDHISRAVVDYAERRRWERLRDGDDPTTPVGLSAVPVGSGPGLGLGVERSVDAVVTGVQRANAILWSQGRPVIDTLEFIERYTGKVERIMQALGRTEERSNATGQRFGRIDLGDRSIEQNEGALTGIPPPSYEGGRWERLSVELRSVSPGDSPIRLLEYRFAQDRAAVSERPRRVDRNVIAELLREAVRRPSRSLALGAVLFEELLPAELKDEVYRIDNLVLQLDATTAEVPWELLVDRLAGSEPLACRAGLLRQYRTDELRVRTGPAVALSALVLGDPPTSYNELPAARREAVDVWRLLHSANVEAQLLQFDDLDRDGTSSAARIKEAFRARDHRIIHIAAHGLYRTVQDGKVEGGVAIGNDAFMTADDFANLRIAPDLVFLNCCHLGRTRPGAELGDKLLDEVDHHQAAASLAKRLMDIGVKAVVVAGWAVGDTQGHTFATEFYREMLDGRAYGDAVRAARVTVFRQFDQTDNTWGAYQCYGDPGFQLATPSAPATATRELPLRAVAARQLEELWVQAGESTDGDATLANLQELDAVIITRWAADGELLALSARVWADLGHFDTAIARYEQAIERSDSAPVRGIEQLVNLSARQAVKLHRAGSADKQALEFATKARKWLDVLRALGQTRERDSIEASLAKRMIILEPDRAAEHLDEAMRLYARGASRVARDQAVDERDLYQFCNVIQLASLRDDLPPEVTDLVTKEWMERWAADAGRTARSGPFWAFVAQPDSMLTAAFVPEDTELSKLLLGEMRKDSMPGGDEFYKLLQSKLKDSAETIASGYLAARPRGRVREWSTVLEHVELMADLAGARRHADAPALQDIYGRLNAKR